LFINYFPSCSSLQLFISQVDLLHGSKKMPHCISTRTYINRRNVYYYKSINKRRLKMNE
jgi:hypothetical protein